MFTLNENDVIQVMNEVVEQFLIPKFNSYDMNATGEWLDTVEVEARNGNEGIIRGRDYSEFLALGRKPGNRPPISMIQRWVEAKLGVQAPESLGVAFAVANKIASEGTTWHQQGGTELLEVLQSQEVIDYVTERFRGLAQVQVQIAFERIKDEVFK